MNAAQLDQQIWTDARTQLEPMFEQVVEANMALGRAEFAYDGSPEADAEIELLTVAYHAITAAYWERRHQLAADMWAAAQAVALTDSLGAAG